MPRRRHPLRRPPLVLAGLAERVCEVAYEIRDRANLFFSSMTFVGRGKMSWYGECDVARPPGVGGVRVAEATARQLGSETLEPDAAVVVLLVLDLSQQPPRGCLPVAVDARLERPFVSRRGRRRRRRPGLFHRPPDRLAQAVELPVVAAGARAGVAARGRRRRRHRRRGRSRRGRRRRRGRGLGCGRGRGRGRGTALRRARGPGLVEALRGLELRRRRRARPRGRLVRGRAPRRGRRRPRRQRRRVPVPARRRRRRRAHLEVDEDLVAAPEAAPLRREVVVVLAVRNARDRDDAPARQALDGALVVVGAHLRAPVVRAGLAPLRVRAVPLLEAH